jgi:hypothetical protein
MMAGCWNILRDFDILYVFSVMHLAARCENSQGVVKNCTFRLAFARDI